MSRIHAPHGRFVESAWARNPNLTDESSVTTRKAAGYGAIGGRALRAALLTGYTTWGTTAHPGQDSSLKHDTGG
jgi:hypothetical protein